MPVFGIKPIVHRSLDRATVYIVDDEEPVRKGFSLLLRSAGLPCRAFSSAKQFLAEVDPQEEGCVLLDITMPQATGLDLQQELNRRKSRLRVIAISARDDADTTILARRLGAEFFFRKPVDDQALIDAIRWVMGSNRPTPTQSVPLPITLTATPNARTRENKRILVSIEAEPAALSVQEAAIASGNMVLQKPVQGTPQTPNNEM